MVDGRIGVCAYVAQPDGYPCRWAQVREDARMNGRSDKDDERGMVAG